MLIRLTTTTMFNDNTGDLMTFHPSWEVQSGAKVALLEFGEDDTRMLKGQEAITAWAKLVEIAERHERIEQAKDIRAQMIMDEVSPPIIDDEPDVDDGDYEEYRDDEYPFTHNPY